MYAVIDIETTGLSAKRDKITEIAIVIHDGFRIVETFTSLINPERHIPANITRLTGINDQMVREAPKFWEIAKKLVIMTEDCVFVAHNASFDYHFIRSEFKSLGYDYFRKTICTVQLAKKLIPGLSSYSLGHLAKKIEINNSARHRAAGDAMATALLLETLLKINDGEIPHSAIRPGVLHKKLLQTIPEVAGVYYFLNAQKDIIYIGKSKNLKSRIQTHLRNGRTKKAARMMQEVAYIEHTVTGSELIALLLESDEIKQKHPKYNRAQRRNKQAIGLFKKLDTNGYCNLYLHANNQQESTPMHLFDSVKEARETLFNYCETYQLCQKLCGLYESAGACFSYHVGECHSACIGAEPAETYNQRVADLETRIYYPRNNFVIRESAGQNEWALVLIKNGRYRGFGKIAKITGPLPVATMTQSIQPYQNNEDVKQILVRYLRENHQVELFFMPD